MVAGGSLVVPQRRNRSAAASITLSLIAVSEVMPPLESPSGTKLACLWAADLDHHALAGQARCARIRPEAFTPTAQGEIRQGLLFRQAVLIAAMVQAMTAWVYALGWVAIKLI